MVQGHAEIAYGTVKFVSARSTKWNSINNVSKQASKKLTPCNTKTMLTHILFTSCGYSIETVRILTFTDWLPFERNLNCK